MSPEKKDWALQKQTIPLRGMVGMNTHSQDEFKHISKPFNSITNRSETPERNKIHCKTSAG